MSAWIPKEDPKRQVPNSDTINGNEPQGKGMISFCTGDLVVARLPTTVWDQDLEQSLSTLTPDDVVLVVKESDSAGWTKVITTDGVQGYIHENNLSVPKLAKVV